MPTMPTIDEKFIINYPILYSIIYVYRICNIYIPTMLLIIMRVRINLINLQINEFNLTLLVFFLTPWRKIILFITAVAVIKLLFFHEIVWLKTFQRIYNIFYPKLYTKGLRFTTGLIIN